MILLILEALGALVLLLLIVWWTMFSGRKNGELPTLPPSHNPADSDAVVSDSAPVADKT